MYKIVLAMVKLKEKKIKSNNMEENFLLLPDMQFYDDISDDLLI